MVSDLTVDLTDPDLFADGPPHDVYRYLRDEAPVYWHEPTPNTPDDEGFWCLTRHEDVAWAARQPFLFSSVSGGGRDGGGTLIEDLPTGFAAGVLLNMQDDPRHQSRAPTRLAVGQSDDGSARSRPNSPTGVRRFSTRRSTAARAISWSRSPPNCRCRPSPRSSASPRRIGTSYSTGRTPRSTSTTTIPGRPPSGPRRPGAAMSSYCARLLEEKRPVPGGRHPVRHHQHADLPDAAGPGGALSDLEQQMFFHLLVAAGSETTRNSITAGLLALMERPEQWDALRTDRSGLPGAVEEMLRWASSTVYNRRTATEEVERHGQVIRPGDKVVLWWQAANFDERAFTDPHAFDIRRSPNPHLAFGAGSHFCLGANLARLEITLVFDGLLDRVEMIESAGSVERTRSNKHAGFRHAPVHLRRAAT